MGKNAVATIYDVAGMARVSMATVSRVLNEPNKVNQETRDRVLKVIEEIGYKPNPIARDLATKKRIPVIGIILLNITHDLVSQILSGIFEAVEDLNYSIKVFQVNKKKSFSQFVSDVMVDKVDGIIFLNDNLEDKKIDIMTNEFDIYKTPYTVVDLNNTKTVISPHKQGFNAIIYLKKYM